LNAHPALYWGSAGYDLESAWLAIGDDNGEPPRGTLRVGHHEFDTTGVLGVSGAGASQKAFPGWLTIPSTRDLATGRRWHLFFAWALLANAAIYLIAGLAGGHFRRDLLLSRSERSPTRLAQDLWNHLRLRFPAGEATRVYNPLQKVSYLAVIGVIAPVIVVTGLGMSPAIDAIAPSVLSVLGGRQSARSLHFIAVNLLLLFFVVHIAALMAVGVWNELRSMLTGRYVIKAEN
jgi:thiosulfate reductase cytochrome b subunit